MIITGAWSSSDYWNKRSACVRFADTWESRYRGQNQLSTFILASTTYQRHKLTMVQKKLLHRYNNSHLRRHKHPKHSMVASRSLTPTQCIDCRQSKLVQQSRKGLPHIVPNGRSLAAQTDHIGISVATEGMGSNYEPASHVSESPVDEPSVEVQEVATSVQMPFVQVSRTRLQS